eukprot:NODE_3635_length_760_cov_789.156028.p2 GENE.NODE_3635_length_760_cov_789.156028~~NODE_3635_length_760_cov_789.156028.p2  ORF type:complete len:212 (+),score=73.57 NODE_3635_length_760_cov_789.156028:3-638(+)
MGEEMKTKDPSLRYIWWIWEQVAQPKEVKGSQSQYSEAMRRVASFSTVKGFWRYWNHIPQPSELLEGKKLTRESGSTKNLVDALMIFREGIRPEWEDPTNLRGGHFLLTLRPNIAGGSADEHWNNIVLGVVGGSIEPAEMITGVRLVDKLGQQRQAALRVEVWFSAHFDDADKVDRLQRSLEKCLCTRLDGSQSNSWATGVGKIDRKSHTK